MSQTRSPQNRPGAVQLRWLRGSRTPIFLPHLMGASAATGCSVTRGGQKKSMYHNDPSAQMYHNVSQCITSKIQLDYNRFIWHRKAAVIHAPS